MAGFRINDGGMSRGRNKYSFDRGLFKWWFSGLLLCLPDSLKPKKNDTNGYYFLLENEAGRLVRRTGSGNTQLGEFSLERTSFLDQVSIDMIPVEIQLPKEKIFFRSVSLPSAVEPNIGGALKYDMDRITPFPEDQVYYDYRVVSRDGDNNSVLVELAVVTKDYFEPWIDLFTAKGVQSVKATADGLWDGCNLLPSDKRMRSSNRSHFTALALSILALFLLAIAMGGPLYQRQTQLSELEDKLDSLRGQTDVVVELRERLDSRNLLSGHVISKRTDYLPAIDIIKDISDRLPDDTWVQQLSTRGDIVEVRGESSQATQLIGILEASPLFKSVAFRSPVVQVQRSDSEKYHISMELQREKVD